MKMNVTIAIVDDELYMRKRIVNLLNQVLCNLTYSAEIQEFSGSNEFLKEKRRFDIIFMDIKMPDGDGFKTAEIYRSYGKEDILIFLTNYDELCKEGYKVSAFRFIGKQDGINEISEAIISAFKIINSREKIKFCLDTGREIYLSVNEICYIEACG